MNHLGKLSRTSSLNCPGFWDSPPGLPRPIPRIPVSSRPSTSRLLPSTWSCATVSPLRAEGGSPESAGAPGGQRLRRTGQQEGWTGPHPGRNLVCARFLSSQESTRRRLGSPCRLSIGATVESQRASGRQAGVQRHKQHYPRKRLSSSPAILWAWCWAGRHGRMLSDLVPGVRHGGLGRLPTSPDSLLRARPLITALQASCLPVVLPRSFQRQSHPLTRTVNSAFPALWLK